MHRLIDVFPLEGAEQTITAPDVKSDSELVLRVSYQTPDGSLVNDFACFSIECCQESAAPMVGRKDHQRSIQRRRWCISKRRIEFAELFLPHDISVEIERTGVDLVVIEESNKQMLAIAGDGSIRVSTLRVHLAS